MPFVAAVVIPTEDTRIQVETATPGTFADIAGVEQFDGPASESAEVKKTNMGSVVQETRGSLIPDNGELSFTIQFDPANALHIQLQADMATAKVRNYQLILNNQSPTSRPFFAFGAWVKSFGRKGGEPENNVLADVVLRVCTPITTGLASSPFMAPAAGRSFEPGETKTKTETKTETKTPAATSAAASRREDLARASG